ncbi:hypothetical protein ES708_24503 [subsurface metagenome]
MPDLVAKKEPEIFSKCGYMNGFSFPVLTGNLNRFSFYVSPLLIVP